MLQGIGVQWTANQAVGWGVWAAEALDAGTTSPFGWVYCHFPARGVLHRCLCMSCQIDLILVRYCTLNS